MLLSSAGNMNTNLKRGAFNILDPGSLDVPAQIFPFGENICDGRNPYPWFASHDTRAAANLTRENFNVSYAGLLREATFKRAGSRLTKIDVSLGSRNHPPAQYTPFPAILNVV